MAPHEDLDLFPWILGGFLLAAAAAGATVIAIGPTARTSLTPASSTPAMAQRPAVVVSRSIEASAAQTPHDLPRGQVWECTLNGQRTFSDAPCGDHPQTRHLSELNRMDATPVAPYAPEVTENSAQPWAGPDVSVPVEVESGTTVVHDIVVLREREGHDHEREHRRRHEHHEERRLN
jgi:hypothetical protein